MSRSRALALLASSVVMLSATVGTTLTPTAAAATEKKYPPVPPSLVCNRGVVKRGDSVRTTGHKYRAQERVVIVIRFKPKSSNHFQTMSNTTAQADHRGDLHFNVPTRNAGAFKITVTGRTSHKTAKASFTAVDKRKVGRHVAMKPVAFTGSGAGGATAPDGNTTGPALGGLAVMVLAGGALVTRLTVRRRRAAA